MSSNRLTVLLRSYLAAAALLALPLAVTGCGESTEVPAGKPGGAPETPDITKGGAEMENFMKTQKK